MYWDCCDQADVTIFGPLWTDGRPLSWDVYLHKYKTTSFLDNTNKPWCSKLISWAVQSVCELDLLLNVFKLRLLS